MIIILMGLAVLQNCSLRNEKPDFTGFWEGPHPEDVHKKFYIRFTENHDTIDASGFWTKDRFYESKFMVDSVLIHSDSIRFFVPGWNCYYSGKIFGGKLIKGGFDCQGEPFDSVNLLRNNSAKRFLTEAKPGCPDPGYTYKYHVPEFYDSSLPVARFQSPHDSVFIYSLIPEIIQNQYGRINSFLMMKSGKLICEEYFYGFARKDMHQIESSTKSITSLLIGMAKDQGMITDLDEPLYKIFPEFPHLQRGEYPKITLAHVLSMTSGFSAEYEPYQDYDRIAFTLKRKLVAPAGEEFIYDGGNTEILGAVIHKKTGMYADKFAKKFLFEPLGIENFDWSIYKQNGFPCMGGSLQMLPVDMLKIGDMVLNNGKFKNHQIVSEDWIRKSTSALINTHIDDDHYGYQWWNITIESNGKVYETIWANGLGSQFIYIIPELDVIIVTTGQNYEYDSWAITKGIGKYLNLLEH